MADKQTKEEFWAALEVGLAQSKKLENQAALALEAGVPQSSITEMLKHQRFGRPETQEKIAKALDFKSVGAMYEFGRKILSERRKPNGRGEVVKTDMTAQAIILDQYVADTQEGPALRKAIDRLATIYKSGDETIIRAISENLEAFVSTVEYRLEVQELKNEVSELRTTLSEFMGGAKKRRRS